jgi:hypothetical protein
MTFPIPADHEMDDLPRTLRREKEARLRDAREREAQASGQLSGMSSGLSAVQPEPVAYSATRSDPYAADHGTTDATTVRRLDIPFLHLIGFFIKAVFAAVPALLLLIVVLWLFGQALEAFFPELLKMKILISFPNS